MKNILKVILSLILFVCIVKVYAYELTYSEWSSEYPKGIDSNLIESEKRYLWYKDIESNIEYLKKEDFNNKLVDYNDFKVTKESEESLIEPEHFIDRVINKKVRNTKYTENDIYGLTINNINFKDKVLLSEIEVINNTNQEKLELIIDEKFSKLVDKNYDEYIENKENINIKFKNNQNVNNLLVKLYYKCNCENDNTFTFNYLSKDEYSIYNNSFEVQNCIMEINPSKLNPNLVKSQTFYTYTDKLYKTYNIERKLTDKYYKDYNDKTYTRLDSSEKTFYRYITNDELVFDDSGNIVTDPEHYCIKKYCIVKKYKKEEVPETPPETPEDTPPEIPEETPKEVPKKINNPKTLDNIYYYFILLTISIILLITIIVLIIKKNIKKIKLKLNNKSSFVELI